MKELISQPAQFRRVEFWAATTIYIFLVFFHISDAVGNEWMRGIDVPTRNGVPATYYFVAQLIYYTLLYLSFLLLNFTIVPRLLRGEQQVLCILGTVLLFLAFALILAWKNTTLKYYFAPELPETSRLNRLLYRNAFLYTAWLLLVFGLYTAIRYAGLYLLTHMDRLKARYPFVTQGGLTALILWMVIGFFMMVDQAGREVTALWGVVVPASVAVYWYALYRLIPQALRKRRPFRSYFFRVLLLVVVAYLPIALLTILLSQDEDAGLAFSVFNSFFQLLITAPFAWIVYKRMQEGTREVTVLKKELGRTHADLDFLRSQINPHFLFNALNTLYGTALQEGAERTGEGVQRLGDMMRFMLQENMQEQIALSREVDYLNNYIALQRLRTDASPNVSIEARIEETVLPVRIAPMLLIPFVENAFKHGISLRAPSHIRISMEVHDKTLNFDVHNSRHQRPDNDPEKDKSGIGLNNVKQRLHLLYPNRHELIIRETGKEFFVHLTLQLS